MPLSNSRATIPLISLPKRKESPVRAEERLGKIGLFNRCLALQFYGALPQPQPGVALQLYGLPYNNIAPISQISSCKGWRCSSPLGWSEYKLLPSEGPLSFYS